MKKEYIIMLALGFILLISAGILPFSIYENFGDIKPTIVNDKVIGFNLSDSASHIRGEVQFEWYGKLWEKGNFTDKGSAYASQCKAAGYSGGKQSTYQCYNFYRPRDGYNFTCPQSKCSYNFQGVDYPINFTVYTWSVKRGLESSFLMKSQDIPNTVNGVSTKGVGGSASCQIYMAKSLNACNVLNPKPIPPVDVDFTSTGLGWIEKFINWIKGLFD